MKSSPPTLNEVKKHWWWNSEPIRKHGVPGVDWLKVKDAARNYELMRRAPHSRPQFTSIPYPELSSDMHMLIHRLWVSWEQPCRYAIGSRDYLESGWSPVYENQHLQWNLKLADNVLAKAFIEQIRIYRGSQNIRAGHPLKNKKNRQASWAYIEILDQLKCADRKPMNASQRHMASVAKRMATGYADQFNQALEAWENRENPMAQIQKILEKEDQKTVQQLLEELITQTRK